MGRSAWCGTKRRRWLRCGLFAWNKWKEVLQGVRGLRHGSVGARFSDEKLGLNSAGDVPCFIGD